MVNAQRSQLWNVPEIQLMYRSEVPVEQRPKITSSFDAFRILRQHWDSSTISLYESFKILLLDRTLQVMGIVEIARGGLDWVAVDLRLIFAAALTARASGVVLAHNHPSSGLVPSPEDKALTEKAQGGGKLLSIHIHDHLIIADNDYFSFNDKGIL